MEMMPWPHGLHQKRGTGIMPWGLEEASILPAGGIQEGCVEKGA